VDRRRSTVAFRVLLGGRAVPLDDALAVLHQGVQLLLRTKTQTVKRGRR
jgi:hypothetical protein